MRLVFALLARSYVGVDMPGALEANVPSSQAPRALVPRFDDWIRTNLASLPPVVDRPNGTPESLSMSATGYREDACIYPDFARESSVMGRELSMWPASRRNAARIRPVHSGRHRCDSSRTRRPRRPPAVVPAAHPPRPPRGRRRPRAEFCAEPEVR